MLVEIIVLLVLIGISAFFSGAEIATMAVSEIRVTYLVQHKKRHADTLKRLRSDKERLLIMILIGNNVANIGAASLATVVAIGLFGDAGVGIATGVMTFLLLIFGEITPKAYCVNNAERVALRIAPFLQFLMRLLYPFIVLFQWFLKLLRPVLRIKVIPRIISEEEIRSIVDESGDKGGIKEIEREMIHNIFRFDDIVVGDIMIARPHIFALDVNRTLGEVMPQIMDKAYSRIPLYEGTFDNIVGALYVKDILNAPRETPLRKVMREVMVIPEAKKVSSLFKEMKSSRRHMAIVVDEYGVVAGLITIEDLIEEIVGEIYDETDEVFRNVRKVDDHTFVIRGDTDIREINQKTRLRLPYKDSESISSIVLQLMGRIPKEHEELHLTKNALIIIETRNRNRIETVRLVKNGRKRKNGTR